MASKNLQPFDATITLPGALTEKLELTQLFDTSVSKKYKSPVALYSDNSNKLNKICSDNSKNKTYTEDLGILLLLGLVSAVESYMRGLIRGLVQVDEWVQKLVASQEVSYYAAVHHETHMLPEALLEGISFISKSNVSKTLKEYCGISGMTENSVPTSLEPIFEKFSQICQIRHCCVHRFGLLGATNALKLGLAPTYFEKPIKISPELYEEISLILEKFVLSLNSYIYSDVLQRSLWMSTVIESHEKINYKTTWMLSFEEDKERFKQYYDLFSLTKGKITSSKFRDKYNEFVTWAQASINEDKNLVKYKTKGTTNKKNPDGNVNATSSTSPKVEAPVNTASGETSVHRDDSFAQLPVEALQVLSAAAAQETPD